MARGELTWRDVAFAGNPAAYGANAVQGFGTAAKGFGELADTLDKQHQRDLDLQAAQAEMDFMSRFSNPEDRLKNIGELPAMAKNNPGLARYLSARMREIEKGASTLATQGLSREHTRQQMEHAGAKEGREAELHPLTLDSKQLANENQKTANRFQEDVIKVGLARDRASAGASSASAALSNFNLNQAQSVVDLEKRIGSQYAATTKDIYGRLLGQYTEAERANPLVQQKVQAAAQEEASRVLLPQVQQMISASGAGATALKNAGFYTNQVIAGQDMKQKASAAKLDEELKTRATLQDVATGKASVGPKVSYGPGGKLEAKPAMWYSMPETSRSITGMTGEVENMGYKLKLPEKGIERTTAEQALKGLFGSSSKETVKAVLAGRADPKTKTLDLTDPTLIADLSKALAGIR